MAPRFGERKHTLFKKCYDFESDFKVEVELRVKTRDTLYCYRSSNWEECSIPDSADIKGPGDFMTHNQALKARKNRGLHTPPQHNTEAHAAQIDLTTISHDSASLSTQALSDIWEVKLEEEQPTLPPPSTPKLHQHTLQREHGTPRPLIHASITPPVIAAELTTDSRGSSPENGDETVVLPFTNFYPYPRTSSPAKRPYDQVSEVQKVPSEYNNCWNWAAGDVESTKSDLPPVKRKRTVLALKPEGQSVTSKKLLGSIPEFVPPPPSLISPLRSTRS